MNARNVLLCWIPTHVFTAALLFAASSASTAHALQVYTGTSCNDRIYVGRWDPPGADSYGTYVCVDAVSGSCSDKRILLTANPLGLQDDWGVYGDSSRSGTGADYMEIMRLTTDTVPSTESTYCQGTWNGLLYNGNFLDLYGDGGNDQIYGGAGDTIVTGNAGLDRVYHYSALGYGSGGTDADKIMGAGSVGALERLYGNESTDCLDDLHGFVALADCGPPSGVGAFDGLRDHIQCAPGVCFDCEVQSASCYW